MSQEDNSKGARKSLKTLQHVASGRENLVGRPSKSLKHQLSQESPVQNRIAIEASQIGVAVDAIHIEKPLDVEVKKKSFSTKEKEIQVNLDSKISVDDLTNPKGASETYWKILAEKRQVALQETLDENERLRKVIEDLKEENKNYKQMLDEANSFVEVIKEELANCSNNDTGIDVNDVSTADETTYEDATDNEPASKKD